MLNIEQMVEKLEAIADEGYPEEYDPLSTPHSTAEIEEGKLKLSHDDGNEWSYGYCWLIPENGRWFIYDMYERNERFFPDDWELAVILVDDAVIAGFTEYVKHWTGGCDAH